jgi:hypothetical protein
MTNGDKNSNYIEEITLALSLLGVVTAALLKINDFFNNNIISSPKIYGFNLVNGLITALLVEFFILFSFFIVKGISIHIEPQKKKEDCEKFARMLFNLSFVYLLIWSIDSVLIYIFYSVITVYSNFLKSYDILFAVFAILYTFFSLLISFWILFNLLNIRITEMIKEIIGTFEYKIEQEYRLAIRFAVLLIVVGILVIIFRDLFSRFSLDFLALPSYILVGSFSIEEFPQSVDNVDNLTFAIKETGLPYNFNYIDLYKINSNSNLTQQVDKIIINRNNENQSNETFMLGKNVYGTWYLVINTTKLQCKYNSGTYMLHAEVTNEISENSTLWLIQKRADKLFYLSPKGANCSFNST